MLTRTVFLVLVLSLTHVGWLATNSCSGDEAGKCQARQRDVQLARQVFDDLRDTVRFTAAKLRPESLARGKQLGRLEFLTEAAAKEIDLRTLEVERLERRGGADGLVAENRQRLESLRSKRDALANRFEELKADHIGRIEADAKVAWTRSTGTTDSLLRALSGELKPATPRPAAEVAKPVLPATPPPKLSAPRLHIQPPPGRPRCW